MDRALRSVGPDKLNEIFGPGTAKQLGEIMEATRIVKTEPPTGFKGSPTFANVITFLERRMSSIPRLGDLATGTVRAVAAVKDLGEKGRQVRTAQMTPLESAMQEHVKLLSKQQRKAAVRRNAPVLVYPHEDGRL
jgi:hypothetical protein